MNITLNSAVNGSCAFSANKTKKNSVKSSVSDAVKQDKVEISSKNKSAKKSVIKDIGIFAGMAVLSFGATAGLFKTAKNYKKLIKVLKEKTGVVKNFCDSKVQSLRSGFCEKLSVSKPFSQFKIPFGLG